jgi:hypothetical protein
MATSIRLTDKRARKLGIIVEPEPATRTRSTTSGVAHALSLNTQSRAILKRIAPICKRAGWQADLARCFTMDKCNETYKCTHPTDPIWNAIVIWREGCRSISILGFLWEIEKWSDVQVVERLEKVSYGS